MKWTSSICGGLAAATVLCVWVRSAPTMTATPSFDGPILSIPVVESSVPPSRPGVIKLSGVMIAKYSCQVPVGCKPRVEEVPIERTAHAVADSQGTRVALFRLDAAPPMGNRHPDFVSFRDLRVEDTSLKLRRVIRDDYGLWVNRSAQSSKARSMPKKKKKMA